jgi:hypothetical protein
LGKLFWGDVSGISLGETTAIIVADFVSAKFTHAEFSKYSENFANKPNYTRPI